MLLNILKFNCVSFQRTIIIVLFIFAKHATSISQPLVYTDPTTLVTGTWAGSGSNIAEISTDNPFEGTKHYKFTYNFNAWWAGCGLNLNNWSNIGGRNFSGYQFIKVAYRGLNGGELRVSLKSGTVESSTVLVGYSTTNYTNVYLPLANFNNVNLSAITEIVFSVGGIQSSNSSFFLDDIKLSNSAGPAYAGQNANHTSTATWARHAKMTKGVNFANWLEAYWLMPSNNYPEINKYTRTIVKNLVNAGMKNVRLPVTFERVASQTAPYTISPTHTMWRLIDSTILWAQQMDFTLIICNHHGIDITDGNFNSEIARKTSIWQQVLARYGSLNPERYFFEIYNEPTNAISNTNLRTFFNALIPAIRNTGSQHSLILGGNNWNSSAGLVSSQKYTDPNLIYTIHDYDPYEFTHQGMSWTTPPYLAPRVFPLPGSGDSLNLVNNIHLAKIWADTSGVPVMVGELGCSTAAVATSRCNWINTISNAMKVNGLGWYYWDAISLSDAFGFFNTSNNTMTTCFASSLKLGSFNTCTKLVTNDLDKGIGSLRDQLSCVVNGDTISFAPSLSGDTIKLYTAPIALNKNVFLRNTSANPVYITSSFNHPLIIVPAGITSKIEAIQLLGREEKVIDNKGVFTIKNGAVQSASGMLFKQQTGNLIFDGTSQIR
jgi:endoglucanase